MYLYTFIRMLNRIKVISFKGEKDKCPMYNVKKFAQERRA